MKKIIDIQNVNIRFGEKIIHPEINFSAFEGQLIALLGKNGIGKTSLLKILTRNMFLPNTGKITIFEQPLNIFSPVEYAKTVSFVSPRREMADFMTVQEFVLMGRYPHKKHFFFSATDKNHALLALEILELQTLKNRYINQLSDGEYQQVAIARAVAQNTQIILLDEPTAFLDVGHKFTVTETLKKLAHQQNKTIIFSSHDLSIVLKQADYIWLMTPQNSLMACPEDMMWQQMLNSLFHKKNYFFDPLSMDFQVGECLETNAEKRLTTINHLTARAFERANVCLPSNLSIEPKDNSYVWKMEKNEFNSITECLFFAQEKSCL